MNEKSINLILPLPISINKAYAWKSIRYKSNDYKKYEQLFNLTMNKYPTYYIEWDKWLAVNYEFYFKLYNKNWTKKVKDLWNLEKILTDCLCKRIKWLEDHKIKEIKMIKTDNEKEFVNVIIYEIE